jgi:hypothetical protein
MKRLVDVLYGLKGYPNAARFTAFKTDFFANGSTPGITMDTAVTNGISVTAATTTAIRVTAASTTGVLLSSTATNGISITGVCSRTGLSVSSASARGIELSGAFTTAAIDITATSGRAIRIGTKGTTYANCTALTISSLGGTLDTDPAKNYMVGVFTKVSGNEDTSATDDLGSAWFRTRVDTGATTPAGYSLFGVKSQLRIYSVGGSASTIKNWAAAGELAVLEVSGATTTFSSGCVAAALYANVALTTTSVIASGAVVAGIVINTGSAAITNTGSAYYGLYIQDYVGSNIEFNAAIKIADSCATAGVAIGTCTTAVDITDASGVTNLFKFNEAAGCILNVDVNPQDDPSDGGLGADACIRVDIGGLDYFIPLFAVERS